MKNTLLPPILFVAKKCLRKLCLMRNYGLEKTLNLFLMLLLLDLNYQMFSYGAVRNKKEPLKSTIIKPMFLIPSTFVLYLLFLPLLSILNIYFVLPLMVYVALNLLFSFYESIRNKDIGTLHLLPAVLFTIHISYGVGFIYGKISRV